MWSVGLLDRLPVAGWVRAARSKGGSQIAIDAIRRGRLKKPWIPCVGGEMLKDRLGRPRRFKTRKAALQCAYLMRVELYRRASQ